MTMMTQWDWVARNFNPTGPFWFSGYLVSSFSFHSCRADGIQPVEKQ